MKIVITGGAGFIGSHVADAYLKAGHRVTVIDDFSRGRRANVDRRAKIYRADIRDEAAMERIFRRERPDAVNHHAARISVIESVQAPAATYEVNIVGLANVLSAFGKFGRGRKFIFASTGGALYGEPRPLPANERAPIRPLSPYGLSKELGEALVAFHAERSGFPYLVLRYANVYGPRQRGGGEAGVVPILADHMRGGKRPILFGSDSTRDYVYVEDVARANLRGLSRGKNETVNIGTGKEISNMDVFHEVARTLAYPGRPVIESRRPGEVKRISLDAGRAKKILGWVPRVRFPEGVRETLTTRA